MHAVQVTKSIRKMIPMRASNHYLRPGHRSKYISLSGYWQRIVELWRLWSASHRTHAKRAHAAHFLPKKQSEKLLGESYQILIPLNGETFPDSKTSAEVFRNSSLQGEMFTINACSPFICLLCNGKMWILWSDFMLFEMNIALLSC